MTEVVMHPTENLRKKRNLLQSLEESVFEPQSVKRFVPSITFDAHDKSTTRSIVYATMTAIHRPTYSAGPWTSEEV